MYNKKVKEIINSNTLFRKFERCKFGGNENELYVIEAIEIEAIRSSHVQASEIVSLNHKIFRYMDQKGEKSYEKFLEYLLKSKVIKPLKLNIQEIRKTTYKKLEEINSLINELEEIKKCH